VSPELWSSIVRALDDSRYLIVLANPGSAQSTWVNREIEHWLSTKPIATVLPVLTGGGWAWDEERRAFSAEGSDAVPPALAAAFTEEPRHLDLRWAHDDPPFDARSPRFRLALAELAAPMRGMSKDELMGEDLRQHRRTMRLAVTVASILVALLVAAVVASFVAVGNANRAKRNEARAEENEARAQEQASIATSRQLAAEARTFLEDQLDLALLLGVASHQERPTVESRAILVDALATAPQMRRFLHGGGQPVVDIAPGSGPTEELTIDATHNVRSWDLDRGTAVDLGTSGPEDRLAIRPHHGEVASAGSAGLSIWSTADGQRRRLDWAPPVLAEGGLAFSDDGELLAATGEDGTVMVLDLDAQRVEILEGEADDMTDLYTFGFAFSLDKRWLAATFGDGGVAIADLRGGKFTILPQQYGHTDRVAFSPDSRSFAFAAAGGEVKVVALPNLEETVLRPQDPSVTEFSGLLSDVFPVAFRPDGSELLVGNPDGVVDRWPLRPTDDPTTARATVLPLARSAITDLAFTDASTVLVADQSGAIEQWDVGAPESFGTTVRRVAEADALAVSEAGDFVAVGGCDPSAVIDLGDAGLECSDGLIVVAPTGDGPAKRIHAHENFVESLTFTADGTAVISGGRDGRIVRSEVQGSGTRTLAEPGSTVTDVVLSPDGLTVASSNFNGAVLLTAVDTGETRTLQPAGDTSGPLGGFEWMTSVAFTPDGAALYGGSREGKLRRWLLPSGAVSPVADMGGDNEIVDLAVSPDGTRLAVLSGGTLRWLDTASGTWTADAPIGDAFVSIAFDPTGSQVAYASSGGAAVTDLESGRLVGEPWMPASASYSTVAWGGPPHDPVLAVTDADGATWWRASDDRLVAAACGRANRELDPDERSRYLLDPVTGAQGCPV
jgi:WD40 repeat protein